MRAEIVDQFGQPLQRPATTRGAVLHVIGATFEVLGSVGRKAVELLGRLLQTGSKVLKLDAERNLEVVSWHRFPWRQAPRAARGCRDVDRRRSSGSRRRQTRACRRAQPWWRYVCGAVAVFADLRDRRPGRRRARHCRLPAYAAW